MILEQKQQENENEKPNINRQILQGQIQRRCNIANIGKPNLDTWESSAMLQYKRKEFIGYIASQLDALPPTVLDAHVISAKQR